MAIEEFRGTSKDRLIMSYSRILAGMESRGLFCCHVLDKPSPTVERPFYAGATKPLALNPIVRTIIEGPVLP